MKVKNKLKKVGETFGEYVIQQYFCTRNRERCGGDMMKERLGNSEIDIPRDEESKKNFRKNLEDKNKNPYLCTTFRKKRLIGVL